MIVGDACVFGKDAYLMIDEIIVSWYATALSNDDEKLLKLHIGDEKHQQVAESLNWFCVGAFNLKFVHRCEQYQLELLFHAVRKKTLKTQADSIFVLL